MKPASAISFAAKKPGRSPRGCAFTAMDFAVAAVVAANAAERSRRSRFVIIPYTPSCWGMIDCPISAHKNRAGWTTTATRMVGMRFQRMRDTCDSSMPSHGLPATFCKGISLAWRAILAFGVIPTAQFASYSSVTAHDSFGSKCEKLKVSITSPLVPWEPT
jgi:hypothetical protein